MSIKARLNKITKRIEVIGYRQPRVAIVAETEGGPSIDEQVKAWTDRNGAEPEQVIVICALVAGCEA